MLRPVGVIHICNVSAVGAGFKPAPTILFSD